MMSPQTQSVFVQQHDFSSDEDDDDKAPLLHDISIIRSVGRGLIVTPRPARERMSHKAWAVAFAVNVAITFLSAVCFLPSWLTVLQPVLETRGWESSHVVLWTLLTVFFVAASAVAVSSIVLIKGSDMSSVQIAMGVYVLVFVAAFTIFPGYVSTWAVLVLSVVCGLILAGILPRDRAHFVAETLKVVATLAVYSIPQIFSWTLCVTVIRCLWLAVSGVACFGSAVALVNAKFDGSSHRPDYCGKVWAMASWSWDCWVSIIPDYGNVSATAFLLVFWTVSVSWTSAIAESVVAATVANLVSSRLSFPDNEDTAWRSCNRVLRSSFG
eukprot:jgi/Undpi1/8460/HiC_scaffold_25.g10927.m1